MKGDAAGALRFPMPSGAHGGGRGFIKVCARVQEKEGPLSQWPFPFGWAKVSPPEGKSCPWARWKCSNTAAWAPP